MSNIIITYNGSTIAEVPEGKTATLHCKGRIPATDIIVRFNTDGKIVCGGKVSLVTASHSAKLCCANRRMMTDAIITAEGDIDDITCVLGNVKLGTSILGAAIRLNTPAITLVVEQLDTPAISLVYDKLATPSIALMEITT